MTWAVFAAMAAALWGFSYVLSERLVENISAVSLLFYAASGATVIFFTIAVNNGDLFKDFAVIKGGGSDFKFLIGIIFSQALASLLMLLSMKAKNATATGLIEISYPLFTALLAWVLFKENHISIGTITGGLLIISGVFCMVFLDKTV